MNLEPILWPQLQPELRLGIPLPIATLFDRAAAASEGLIPRGLNFGEEMIQNGALVTATTSTKDDTSRRFLRSVSDGATLPIGFILDKTMEVSAAQPDRRYIRASPTTLLYPGDAFGLWEFFGFGGPWTISAGCRSFLVPKPVANKRRARQVFDLPQTNLSWSDKSRLEFWRIIRDYKTIGWRSHVLLVDPREVHLSDNLASEFRLSLAEHSIQQLFRALNSSRDQRFRYAIEQGPFEQFANTLSHVIAAISSGSMCGYYVATGAIDANEINVDLPIAPILDTLNEYLAPQRQEQAERRSILNDTLPLFVPCLLTKEAQNRTFGRAFLFPDQFPTLGRDFQSMLDDLLRDQFSPNQSHPTVRIPELRRIEATTSRFASRRPEIPPHHDCFTEALFNDHDASSHNPCIVRFYINPGNQRPKTDFRNRCCPEWIPLTYPIDGPISLANFDQWPSQAIWPLQIELIES